MTDRPAGSPLAATGAQPSSNGSARRFPGLAPDHQALGNMDAVAVRFSLSTERLLWIVLFIVAALTRLWDLGYRTQHHDEGIHTTFALKFATGEQPYVHNPLSHGPFLFHANALIYQLFGANDATSRLLPALAGIGIVLTPWLLRDRAFLGRWGALAAGALLLFSPTFLYYTRFIRHDPYTALGSLLLLAAIFRYLHAPERKWILLAFVSVAFLLTNHEIAFAILLGFVIVLWGALVLSRLRMLIPVHLAALAAVFLLLALNGILDWEPLPAIPWENGSTAAQQEYYSQLLTHPLAIGMLVIGVAFVIGGVAAMRAAARRRSDSGAVMGPLLGDAPQGSVAKGVYDAWRDPVSLGIGALLALWIFVGLFTTLFTHLNGIATATYATNGTLLYWLGQQGVRRGQQPWFYFITEAIQYEWLVILVGFVGLVALAVVIVRRLAARDFSFDPRILFRVLVAFWMLFMFLVLSYAGEKMPWLLLHILLPAALLGAVVVQELATSAGCWYRRWRARRADGHSPALPALLALLLVGLAGAFFLIAANLTQGGFGIDLDAARRSVPDQRLDDWWVLVLPLVTAIAAIAVVWLLRGARPTLYGAAAGLLAVMLLFQIHAGFRLSFLEGDVSVDTMIYNTVGPDAKQVVQDVKATSQLYLGDNTITVSNDNETNWPLEWYFRDMPNWRYMDSIPADTSNLPAFIIGVIPAVDPGGNMPDSIPGYTTQTYVFRWHEPEAEVYRNFAIAPEIPMGRSAWQSADQDTGLAAIARSVWSSLTSTTDPDEQQKLWRLLMYRELPGQMSRFKFNVYIDNDILPYYNEVRYGQ